MSAVALWQLGRNTAHCLYLTLICNRSAKGQLHGALFLCWCLLWKLSSPGGRDKMSWHKPELFSSWWMTLLFITTTCPWRNKSLTESLTRELVSNQTYTSSMVNSKKPQPNTQKCCCVSITITVFQLYISEKSLVSSYFNLLYFLKYWIWFSFSASQALNAFGKVCGLN